MTSETVRLRQWKEDDLDLFAEMNADPDVTRYFVKKLTREESSAALARFRSAIDEHGWGLWAVDVDGAFAGFTGLTRPTFSATFTPCIEIGWRLRREFWGKGIAFRAAREAESYAFTTLRLSELVSFTTETNLRSRRLMERLGFARNPQDDFIHPLMPSDHPLIRHVLYRKKPREAL